MTEAAGSSTTKPMDRPSARRIGVIVVNGLGHEQPGDTAQRVVDLLTVGSPPGTDYRVGTSDTFAIQVSAMPAEPTLAFEGIARLESGAVAPDRAKARASGRFMDSVRSAWRRTKAREGRVRVADVVRIIGTALSGGNLDVGPAPAFGERSRREPAADTSRYREGSWLRKLQESLRSDFQRTLAPNRRTDLPNHATVADDRPFRVQRDTRPAYSPESAQRREDRGLRFTQYLLQKALDADSPPERYASRMIRLQRLSGTDEKRVDVYEMHWADLARPQGRMGKVVAELLIMYRLSRMARDVVNEAARFGRGAGGANRRHWLWLSTFQTILDWSLTNVFAHLVAQLVLLYALTTMIGLAAPHAFGSGDMAVESSSSMHRYLFVIGLGVAVFAALSIPYFGMGKPRRGAVAAAVVALLLAMVMIGTPQAPLAFALLALALVTAIYGRILRAADERLPFTFATGMTMWGALLFWMAWQVKMALLAEPDVDPWRLALQGAMSSLEATLWLIRAWWLVAAIPLTLWSVLSVATYLQPHDQRASAATGRLGLLVAMGGFVALMMVAWAGLEATAVRSLGEMNYTPVIWTVEDGYGVPDVTALTGPISKDSARDPMRCLADEEGERPAARFLDCRFRATLSMLTVVTVMLLLVAGYVALTALPSVLAALSAPGHGNDGLERRKRWRAWLYRWLDFVVLLLTVSAVVAAVWFVLVLGGLGDYGLSEFASTRSGQLLALFVIPPVTAFVALVIFGRYLPGLRAPLDTVLDVENYLREYPRHQIPRARIFARYRALLRHVRAQSYDRVVIVAHGQGSVVSAEFLRFIASQSTRYSHRDRGPRLEALMKCEVRLLSVGCLLREIYATRFPVLYRWMKRQAPSKDMRRAEDIGASVWLNASNESTGFGAGRNEFAPPKSVNEEDRSIVAYRIDQLIAD